MPQPELKAKVANILKHEDPARRMRELTALREQAPLDVPDTLISFLGWKLDSILDEARRVAASR